MNSSKYYIYRGWFKIPLENKSYWLNTDYLLDAQRLVLPYSIVNRSFLCVKCGKIIKFGQKVCISCKINTYISLNIGVALLKEFNSIYDGKQVDNISSEVYKKLITIIDQAYINPKDKDNYKLITFNSELYDRIIDFYKEEYNNHPIQ